MDEKSLDSYIVKISEFIKEKNTAPDKLQMQAIALEVGFSETDVEAFEADLHKRKVLAFGYLRHGLVAEAKEILDDLRSIFPDDRGLDELETQVLFHQSQWPRTPLERKSIVRRLEELAVLDPSNEQAIAILSRFTRAKKNTGSPNSEQSVDRRRRQIIMFLAIMVIGVVFWGFKFGFFKWNTEKGQSETIDQEQSLSSLGNENESGKKIKTEFYGDGLTLDVWSLKTDSYKDGFSLGFSGTLTAPTLEISDIDLSYELYLKNGELYKKDTLPVLINGSKNIPGDAIPIYFYLFEDDRKDPGIDLLKIIVRDVNAITADRADYPAIDLDFDKTAYTGPEHTLKLALQSVRLSQGTDETYAYIYISMINAGKRPILVLKLESVWTGSDGKQAALVAAYGVTESVAPILPGQSRTLFMIPSWPASSNIDPSKMKITILELE